VDRLRGRVVQADGAALVAFFAQAESGFFTLLPKVFAGVLSANMRRISLIDGMKALGCRSLVL
jgi:hypothetical protein